ncbi:cytoplasmic dynein 1 light intermediate chain 2 isoform X1 [Rhinoraja longicauda]
MAPVGERKHLGAAAASNQEAADEDDGPNLWTSILSEVSTRSRSKLPTGKNILVLGEDGSGKTTLMAKLQGAEHNKKGRGLEYLYLNIHDEDRDDHTRCNVWILDGELYHKGLLKFAVSGDNLKNTLAIFVADMARPWTIMDSLQKWASVLREHIDKLKIPPEEIREMEQKLVKEFQEYVEPEEGTHGSPQRRAPVPGQEEEEVVLPLCENALTHNLGIPVLVVCTKCDAVSLLEKEHDYRDEHFDFIQSHIRRFCLEYGAALIYTSIKEEKNVDLLYKYLVHKMYDFQFTTPALVVEKDAVFIPAGWDKDKKIAILHENFATVKQDDAYEEIIGRPLVKKPVHDKEVASEDEQVFLMKQQSLLAKQPATPSRPADSPRQPGGSPRTPRQPGGTNMVTAVPPITSGTPKGERCPAAANEGVLANFFNSLLSKKTGSPGSPGAGGVQNAAKKPGQKPVLTDVQAELDRMSRKPDPVVTTNSSPTENEA